MHESHTRTPRWRAGVTFRIAIVLLSTATSFMLVWFVLIGPHLAAHAAAPTIRETAVPSPLPWGIGFDTSGNVWVAETGCDPNPLCSPSPGAIAQFSQQNFSLIQNYAEPGNFSNPLFLALDANGNIWFTEPNSNAIGELIPNNGNPTWHQWTVPTANAAPYDLAFDWSGNLWFTEFTASKIGEFHPQTQQFTETSTPTGNSNPYGMSGPDPTTGSLWFTENNSAVSRIGRFTPPLNGQSLTTGSILEYPTLDRVNSTPHLIAFDSVGNIWWTEGFDGHIGRLIISQSSNGTSNGISEFAVPSACQNCGMHISGIGADSTGTIWFDDSLNSRIGSYVPRTNTFSMYTVHGSIGSNSHPHDGLAVDGNNSVWFSEEFAGNLGEAIQSGIPTPTPGVTATAAPPLTGGVPVSKQWYFAEGAVGNHFTEVLTVDNPNASYVCDVDAKYLYTISGGQPAVKTVSFLVQPSTRITESVNKDLNISPNQQSSATNSTILTIDPSTPNCPGVVAERPMYYNISVNSGDDVLGATTTDTTFYFADIATGGGFKSYLTILNPGTSNANVIATYYANGQVVGTQTLTVLASSRNTIYPTNARLPLHVAAVVTSNQPIVVERPVYFVNINGGNAGTVSGSHCIFGTQTLSHDWLFAEGYAGTGFQENLIIANEDNSANRAASVTIKLEYSDGSSLTYTVTVNPKSQLIWNVNQHGKALGTAAEVSSRGANIVVEREMFFHYHVNSNNSTAVGGTDATGEVGPATKTAYSFAEGYVNKGFDEYLTIQNPTASAERVFITLINGYSRTYTQWFQVGPNTRLTVSIYALSFQYLIHPGDGNFAYEISMTLQSFNNAPFVAERPMYWNTAGVSSPSTSGGTDIVGFTG